ncbi:hypothetical protein LZ32DRAFT_9010 [Colletotrichum eremochloae]|nr:hypothetical protein LZ32DRAFT_9010 [Colletotrichum eremochloae]
MLSSRLLTVLGFVGIVAAFPRGQVYPSVAAQCPQTICIDGINPECNKRWGGCYDSCKPDTKPTMPPCKPTPSRSVPIFSLQALHIPLPLNRVVSPLTTTPPSTSTAKSAPRDNCSTRTVCVDHINECGQMYGG